MSTNAPMERFLIVSLALTGRRRSVDLDTVEYVQEDTIFDEDKNETINCTYIRLQGCHDTFVRVKEDFNTVYNKLAEYKQSNYYKVTYS